MTGAAGESRRRGPAGGGAARQLGAVGLVVLLGGALVIAGLASESTLIRPFVLDDPLRDDPLRRGDRSPVWFPAALMIVALVHLVAWTRTPRTRGGRRFTGWLIGVSALAVLWFAWLAVLGTGFYAAARGGVGAAEALSTGILYVVAYAGPAVASLLAAVALARRRGRRTGGGGASGLPIRAERP